MSSDPNSSLQVTFTPEFKRNLRQLAKRYRHIKTDLQPILNELGSGSKPGDQVPGVRYEVFKVCARNSDASKGKSGGYQLIYQPQNSRPTRPYSLSPTFGMRGGGPSSARASRSNTSQRTRCCQLINLC